MSPVRLAIVLGALAVCCLAGTQEVRAAGISYTCTPGPCGVWRSIDVRLDWDVDLLGDQTGCGDVIISTEGRNRRTCSVSGQGSLTAEILIDKTPPIATGIMGSPGPNARGWHTGVAAFTVHGHDAGPGVEASGLGACDRINYLGPDTPNATVSGTCRDVAGNIGAAVVHRFRFDATPPSLKSLSGTIGDRMLTLRWRSDSADAEIVRRPGRGGATESTVFRGRKARFADTRVTNGVAYDYRVTVTDDAGNVTTRTLTARPSRRILTPGPRQRVTSSVPITWSEIRNADYYNVQVFRGGAKVLSTWPRAARLRLPGRWRYLGDDLRLTRGTYRVFVWPGFGPRARERYGRIVGSVTFVVP